MIDIKTRLTIIDWIEEGLVNQTKQAIMTQSYIALIQHLKKNKTFSVDSIIDAIPQRLIDHLDHCDDALKILDTERESISKKSLVDQEVENGRE